MWGIFIGSLLFVLAILYRPSGVDWIIATAGLTLALAATARYAADLMTPAATPRHTVYDEIHSKPTTIKLPPVM